MSRDMDESLFEFLRRSDNEYWMDKRGEIAELTRQLPPDVVQQAVIVMCKDTSLKASQLVPFLYGWLQSALEVQKAQRPEP